MERNEPMAARGLSSREQKSDSEMMVDVVT